MPRFKLFPSLISPPLSHVETTSPQTPHPKEPLVVSDEVTQHSLLPSEGELLSFPLDGQEDDFTKQLDTDDASHALREAGFNAEDWFATPAIEAASPKMMLEIIVSWEGGILDICHYRHPRRVTFGADHRADFSYPIDDLVPAPYARAFPLIEAGGGGFLLTFSTEMHGIVEHNGERFTFKELVKAGRAHSFHRSGCCHYPLFPGAKVQIDLNGLEINLRFVPVPPLQMKRIRQLGFQAPILSFSVLAHLIFALFAVASSTSPDTQDESAPIHAPAPSPRFIYLPPIYLGAENPPAPKASHRSKHTHDDILGPMDENAPQHAILPYQTPRLTRLPSTPNKPSSACPPSPTSAKRIKNLQRKPSLRCPSPPSPSPKR